MEIVVLSVVGSTMSSVGGSIGVGGVSSNSFSVAGSIVMVVVSVFSVESVLPVSVISDGIIGIIVPVDSVVSFWFVSPVFVGVSIGVSVDSIIVSLVAPVTLVTIVSGISIAPVFVPLAVADSNGLFDILSFAHGTKRAIQSNEVSSVTGT